MGTFCYSVPEEPAVKLTRVKAKNKNSQNLTNDSLNSRRPDKNSKTLVTAEGELKIEKVTKGKLEAKRIKRLSQSYKFEIVRISSNRLASM